MQNRMTSHSSESTDSPLAWRVASAAFTVCLIVFGLLYIPGTFLAPMMQEFHATNTAGSALFAASNAGFYFVGALTGYLGDKFGPRVMTAIGAVLIGGGLILTSIAQSIWSADLAFGIGVGLGAAFAYIPSLAAVGGWFKRLRSRALGFVAAGTAIGVLSLPPVCVFAIERIGWRWTYLTLGCVSAILMAICSLAIRQAPVEPTRDLRPLRGVLFSPAYIALYFSWLLVTTALFVAFVFLPAFARQVGANDMAASILITLIGGASLIGRLCIGHLSEKVGIMPMFQVSVILMAASFPIWLFASDYVELVIFAILLGLGYGMRIVMTPVVLVELFGAQQLGRLFGIFFTGTGLSSILGPLVAGAIVDWTGNYWWAIVFAMITAAVGTLLILPMSSRQEDGAVES